MKLPQTILIQETNFSNAWARAVRQVLRDGYKITIGDTAEPKPVRDACALIELTGDAIGQIENHELHPQFPFRHVDPYCEEFTREYLDAYIDKPERERFSYLYFERLSMYEKYVDQLDDLRWQLSAEMASGISTNRHQAITWKVQTDLLSPSPPCLQRIWIRYLGDDCVEVHMDWRSRDLFTAWQANIIALINMMNREVIRPNGCRIVKLVDYSDSLHIHESDVAAARDVKMVLVSPQTRRA